MDWTFPVHKPESGEVDDGRTAGSMARRALPREKAFEIVQGDDRRPLLILRECNHCKGSADALLSRTMNNDKTILLSKWFRCVKLPLHVLEHDHPFRNLFHEDEPAHVFLADSDGSDPVRFAGDQSQSDLWRAMRIVLDRNYEGDIDRVLKQMQRILAQYDRIDSLEEGIRRRLDKDIEKHGPDSLKVRKHRAKLAELDAERQEWIAKEEELRASVQLREDETADVR